MIISRHAWWIEQSWPATLLSPQGDHSARSRFDKFKAEKRLVAIVEGLIRVISILDEVIVPIRASENKSDAKENLKVSYDLPEEQAEAHYNWWFVWYGWVDTEKKQLSLM